MAPPQAHELIDQAFSCIAEIHQLMSFHESGSDLYRLNQEAARRPVQVDQKAWHVISAAQAFSLVSAGCFDATVASTLAESGLLPCSAGTPIPGTGADWRDVELLPGNHIRFRRPLWLDLGGIAKGYAVDCAVELLRRGGVTQGCVNAGGDLRVFGSEPERVHLLSATTSSVMPVLEICDAAVASSGGDGTHFNGVTRVGVDPRIRVSVVAPDCMTADALTKIVLADSRLAESLLPQYRAVAYINDPLDDSNSGWRTIAAPEAKPC
jgi:thiamine biosynthesis lipoprotein